MHHQIRPAILYFGTPVVLVSSTNEDDSANLAPMSSAWWLGQNCMLGFDAREKTPVEHSAHQRVRLESLLDRAGSGRR
jgi:flavin reductase (DIM6/NTAB) family NADH-FMN oxidoreductase RutF